MNRYSLFNLLLMGACLTICASIEEKINWQAVVCTLIVGAANLAGYVEGIGAGIKMVEKHFRSTP